MKLRYLSLFAAMSLALSCGDSGDDSGSGSQQPTAALPIAPVNNAECTTGVPVSDTQSRVTFEWNPAENTVGYFLYVKNLLTNVQNQYNANSALSYEVNLIKGVPYSWYVTSRSESGSNVNSQVWKFYNAGNGVQNYAPFPAEVVSPGMSSTVTGGMITLEWTADDPDHDIVQYRLYFGTDANPTTLLSTTTVPRYENLALSPATQYYWKVITQDAAGNTSNSPVFQFRTN